MTVGDRITKSHHRGWTSTALAVVFALLVAAVLATPVESRVTAARKCAAAKVKAAAAKASAKLTCRRTAITKGIDVDPACLAKAEAAFAKTFAALEAKGGCVTTGDADTVEGTVDDFVDQLLGALVPDAVFATPTPTVAGTPGPTSTPQPTPTCDNPLTHSNGLGNDYLDCSPLGTPGDASTYTLFMAEEARDAWPLDMSVSRSLACPDGNDSASCVEKAIKGDCAVWCFTGSIAGYVRASVGSDCLSPVQCPTTSDTSWD